MSRAPEIAPGLLLVAGRVQGVPQISFNVEPVGTVTSNVEGADVCGPMQPNSLKRMMCLKLVGQATKEVIGLSDI